MTAGTFILSLDCEGKWGMADGLTADHHRWITTANLRTAYTRLLDLFDELKIAATFAFVMAFLLSEREQRECDHLLQDHDIEGTSWLAAFRAAQRTGNMEGWSMPELLDTVQACDRHEIGCHGFSHLPLGERLVPEAVMRHEIAAAVTVAGMRAVRLDTFIYPRNIVGHPHVLGDAGFLAYRDELRPGGGLVKKACHLLSEFKLAERPQRPKQPSRVGNGPIAIPSGHFFNWRHGVRRLVPPAVTERRWSAMLERSAREGGVVHLWLHPHNIISAPETLPMLRSVLRHVARLRDAGRIVVQTQRDFGTHALATR